MIVNFIEEDFAIFEDVIKLYGDDDLKKRIKNTVILKTIKTDCGYIELVKIDICENDIKKCASFLFQEFSKRLWNNEGTDGIKEVFEQMIKKSEKINA